MSVVYCHACDTQVDTDFNAEHFDVEDVEITVKKYPDMYELQIIQGDTINKKYMPTDEYDVGELITKFIGDIKYECEQ